MHNYNYTLVNTQNTRNSIQKIAKNYDIFGQGFATSDKNSFLFSITTDVLAI